jgi:hypothetical protein
MSRLMSVAFTEQAVRDRTKTVTRRKGWLFAKPGDRVTLCRKVMGRKPGEPLERICDVEIVSVRREPLCAVAGPYVENADGSTTWPEMVAEGFPDMHPDEFMRKYFFDVQRITAMDEVTRIEWRYLDDEEGAA